MKNFNALTILFVLINHNTYAQTPIFSITPLVASNSTYIKGEIGTAIYQVTNNAPVNLSNISLTNLPTGLTQVADAGVAYCNSTINLNSNESCLIKLRFDSSGDATNLSGGPIICYSASRPLYCSQPLRNDQLQVNITNASIPQSCTDNVNNFNYTLTQNFANDDPPDPTWGPYVHIFTFSPANPDLRNCRTSAGTTWQQNRVLAAAAFWISQKLNYCHHHVPDWPTPLANRNAVFDEGGYCSPFVDLMPGTTYYNQAVRWNYSGNGSETLNQWQNNNRMWYGLDCSNYTAFLYSFALGVWFTGETGWQAGQAEDNSQIYLSPNQQTAGNKLENPNAAGKLICNDNTLEVNHSCSGHGGYISVISSTGTRDEHAITDSILENLHPGDLIYIAANLQDGTPDSKVTHVVMWTGKKVGTGAADIPASQIAPDSLCPQSAWYPQTNDWVITDSHYQGPDYRVFSQCFYRMNVWGIRRVIE